MVLPSARQPGAHRSASSMVSSRGGWHVRSWRSKRLIGAAYESISENSTIWQVELLGRLTCRAVKRRASVLRESLVRVLLVNPPIYDFSAYDFWLKPYGLLHVAGMIRGQAELELFDYLDRLHPAIQSL